MYCLGFKTVGVVAGHVHAIRPSEAGEEKLLTYRHLPNQLGLDSWNDIVTASQRKLAIFARNTRNLGEKHRGPGLNVISIAVKGAVTLKFIIQNYSRLLFNISTQ